MGVKNLLKYLRDHNNSLAVERHLSEFKGMRFAVDCSIFLYKFSRSTIDEHGWISTMLLMLMKLRKYGIKPVFVFDGPNCPPEKTREREERRANMEKVRHKIVECKRLTRLLEKKYKPGMVCVEEELQHEIRTLCSLKEHEDVTNYDDADDVIKTLKQHTVKLEKQSKPITKEHSEITKTFMNFLGLSWIQSDGEAEKDAAFLVMNGQCDNLLGGDSDVLVYGCPSFLTNLDLRRETVTEYKYEEILTSLELSPESFTDFCIMCSCDYNERLPKVKGSRGYGPSTCYKLIKEHGRIEKIEKILPPNVSTKCLNYRRCRELFSYDEDTSFTVGMNRRPKWDNFAKLLEKYSVKTPKFATIVEAFKPLVIIATSEE